MNEANITSRVNPLVVRTAELLHSSARRETGLFTVEGSKLFAEALVAGLEPEYVLVTAKAMSKQRAELEKLSCTVYTVTDQVYFKCSSEKAPEGILAVFRLPLDIRFEIRDFGKPVVVLSDIQDPGNVGTVLRTSCALADVHVVLCGDCADLFSPRTLRASMGAAFKQPVTVCADTISAVRALADAGYCVTALALRDASLPPSSLNIDSHSAFVLGNEGHGLSEDVIAACRNTVMIPMRNMESLNVAACAAVILWQIAQNT